MNAVELGEVEKRFGPNRALRSLSLTLPVGSLAAVLGPNGAGKSTLLGVVAGLIRPTRGELLVLGTAAFGPERASLRGRIGYLGAEVGLYGELSLRENLEFYSNIHGIAAERTHSLIHELELEGIAEQRVSSLSFGYRRRAGLARALLLEPDLLLLDEPWNGLDQQAGDQLAERLRQRRSRGGTTLVVTHATRDDVPFDHQIRLNAGRLEAAA